MKANQQLESSKMFPDYSSCQLGGFTYSPHLSDLGRVLRWFVLPYKQQTIKQVINVYNFPMCINYKNVPVIWNCFGKRRHFNTWHIFSKQVLTIIFVKFVAV